MIIIFTMLVVLGCVARIWLPFVRAGTAGHRLWPAPRRRFAVARNTAAFGVVLPDKSICQTAPFA